MVRSSLSSPLLKNPVRPLHRAPVAINRLARTLAPPRTNTSRHNLPALDMERRSRTRDTFHNSLVMKMDRPASRD